jgi:hypothetical protein
MWAIPSVQTTTGHPPCPPKKTVFMENLERVPQRVVFLSDFINKNIFSLFETELEAMPCSVIVSQSFLIPRSGTDGKG